MSGLHAPLFGRPVTLVDFERLGGEAATAFQALHDPVFGEAAEAARQFASAMRRLARRLRPSRGMRRHIRRLKAAGGYYRVE